MGINRRHTRCFLGFLSPSWLALLVAPPLRPVLFQWRRVFVDGGVCWSVLLPCCTGACDGPARAVTRCYIHALTVVRTSCFLQAIPCTLALQHNTARKQTARGVLISCSKRKGLLFMVGLEITGEQHDQQGVEKKVMHSNPVGTCNARGCGHTGPLCVFNTHKSYQQSKSYLQHAHPQNTSRRGGLCACLLKMCASLSSIHTHVWKRGTCPFQHVQRKGRSRHPWMVLPTHIRPTRTRLLNCSYIFVQFHMLPGFNEIHSHSVVQ